MNIRINFLYVILTFSYYNTNIYFEWYSILVEIFDAKFGSFFILPYQIFSWPVFILVNTYVFKQIWTCSNTFADAKTSCITYPSVITKIHLLHIQDVSKNILVLFFFFHSMTLFLVYISSPSKMLCQNYQQIFESHLTLMDSWRQTIFKWKYFMTKRYQNHCLKRYAS